MNSIDSENNDDETVSGMLFTCEFCGEKGMALEMGRMNQPWAVPEHKTIDCVVMKCVECGVYEPCEGDDLIGFLMELTGKKSYHDAIVTALRIVWKETHLKEMTE